jgi:hypothetical protein
MSDHIPPDDLSAWLDDELAPERRAAVATHLAACARCRHELAELEATVALVRAMPRTPLPAGVSFRLPVEPAPAPRRWPALSSWLALGATAAVVVGLAGLLAPGAAIPAAQPAAEPAVARYEELSEDAAAGLSAPSLASPEAAMAPAAAGDAMDAAESDVVEEGAAEELLADLAARAAPTVTARPVPTLAATRSPTAGLQDLPGGRRGPAPGWPAAVVAAGAGLGLAALWLRRRGR